MSVEKFTQNTEHEAYIIRRDTEHAFSFYDKNGTEYKFSIGEQTDIHVYPRNGPSAIFRNSPLDHRKGVYNSDNLPAFVPPEIVVALKKYLTAKIGRHSGMPSQEVSDATAVILQTVQSLASEK